ncbi:glycosyltransferase [Enterocloster sp. HCN-30185]|uniref:glycosyltransferase n=1 Tax=Enterocloster sp. HCN-30185 TaxID=3134663 RepID=UPI0030BA9359
MSVVVTKKVTIVIPVYKDWSTLKLCISSLKSCVSDRNKVLLINDMGPDWEKIENNILSEIEGYENFQYFRNDKNLGFVKTCNRAVFELDHSENDILLLNSDTEVTPGFLEEMQSVLYAAEKHGVVCPRSNNATLLTIPVKNELNRNITASESYSVYLQIKDSLPKQQVMPTGVGFAFLIKRELIKQYGLFDEIYSPGYNEENDFCMRINQYGFNVLMANRAYVFHHESRSFGEKKHKLDEEHARILSKRYPYYWNRVDLYFSAQMSVVDYYADLLSDEIYPKKRILISLYEMPAAYNGTAQHGLLLLENFYRLFKDKYEIGVLVNAAANDFFDISSRYPNVFLPEQLTQRYHLAYVPSQIIHIEHLHILNRVCVRYAFCMQDIISIRSSYLLVEDWEREAVFRKSIKYCSGIVPFSHFSLDDMVDYYSEEFDKRKIYTKIVYLAGVEDQIENTDAVFELPYTEYFVVLGNQYKHKNLDLIIDSLHTSKHNFIIIGSKNDGNITENIFGYKSGNLSNDFLHSILQNSIGIIFPSVYEGFGLPILNAINYNKKIIINNNPLNREQVDVLKYYKNNIYLFDGGEEIEEYLDKIKRDPVPQFDRANYKERTWTNVAEEVEKALEEILKEDVDLDVLKQRWEEMRYLERVHRCYMPSQITKYKISVRTRVISILKNYFPMIYKILKNIRRKVYEKAVK